MAPHRQGLMDNIWPGGRRATLAPANSALRGAQIPQGPTAGHSAMAGGAQTNLPNAQAQQVRGAQAILPNAQSQQISLFPRVLGAQPPHGANMGPRWAIRGPEGTNDLAPILKWTAAPSATLADQDGPVRMGRTPHPAPARFQGPPPMPGQHISSRWVCYR